MSEPHPTAIGGLSADALSRLLQSIEGLRNRRALVAMLGCLVIGVLVAGTFSLLAARLGFFMGLLGGLGLFIAGATGVNAAGVLLMDQARGLAPRSLTDAVVYGLLCIPKFILLGLALLAVALAVFIVLALLFFICKLPWIGPVLFVAVFPLSVVIAGLTLSGLMLCLLLALPAIWEGATVTRAVAQALAIARSRLVESLLLMAVLWLLSMVVGAIVFGVLFTGLMPALGLSSAILGGDGLDGMIGMMQGRGEFGDPGGRSVAMGDAGHAGAAVLGAGLLWALAGSLVSLVYLLGLNLVYLRVTEGLDVGATEAALRARLDDAKRQAADLGQKARSAAERAREQARQAAAAAQASAAARGASPPAEPTFEAEPAPPPEAPVPASDASPAAPAPPAVAVKTLSCPQCASPVGSADVFCGVCGYKLK